jgi:hypothetical protein
MVACIGVCSFVAVHRLDRLGKLVAASLLAQVQIMEQLIPMLTQRKAEQARLRRQKQALKTTMQPHLSSLLRWLGGGYVGHELLPDTLRQQASAAAHADEWSVGEGAAVPHMCTLVWGGE